MSAGRNSKLWKTLFYRYARDAFYAQLRKEIRAHAAKAARKGLKAAIRLDGCSDTGMALDFCSSFPDVDFYEYTKDIDRAMANHRARRAGLRKNMHFTFSWSGENFCDVYLALRHGINVAIAFRDLSEALDNGWHDFQVIDGDVTDYRPADPAGVVVGLSVKGQGLPENTHGFVVENA